MKDLTLVLEEWSTVAGVLKRAGHERESAQILALLSDVRDACPDLLTWLSEGDAALRAGWSTDQVRRHARKYTNTSYVRYAKGKYQLLAIIVPRRLHPEMVQADARTAA